MAGTRSKSFALLAVLAFLGVLAVAGPGVAQEVLTNDAVIKMVKAGLPESVVIQKIQTSQKRFDTSTDGLIKLKGAGVSDKVIEAMMAPAGGPATAAVPPPAAAKPAEPALVHLVGSDQKPLKPILGTMETRVEPFGGARQEVVLPDNKAQYRITQKDPVFISPSPDHQWILVRLKPGKRDRNLPMGGGGGFWGYGDTTFRHGVDPKYNIKLTMEPSPKGGIQIKPAEPLKPGEYGFVAATRGQVNMNEVFDFAVE
jgi:hypothetical protein